MIVACVIRFTWKPGKSQKNVPSEDKAYILSMRVAVVTELKAKIPLDRLGPGSWPFTQRSVHELPLNKTPLVEP